MGSMVAAAGLLPELPFFVVEPFAAGLLGLALFPAVATDAQYLPQ